MVAPRAAGAKGAPLPWAMRSGPLAHFGGACLVFVCWLFRVWFCVFGFACLALCVWLCVFGFACLALCVWLCVVGFAWLALRERRLGLVYGD